MRSSPRGPWSRTTFRPAPSSSASPRARGARCRSSSCSRIKGGSTPDPVEGRRTAPEEKRRMTALPTKTTMQVPLLDLKAQYNDIRADIDDAVRRVMESTRFIGGPEVTGLEEEVARYSQSPHGIA